MKIMKNNIKYLIICLALLNCPAFSSILFNIDDCLELYKKGDINEAQEAFKEYIINNPNDKNGYWWLAKIQSQLKNNKSAKENFKKSYAILAKERNVEVINFDLSDDNNIEDYFDMAAMYFETGDYKNAEFYADSMLKINHQSPSAYFIKAQIAYALSDTEKARKYLNKAISFNNKLIDTNLAKNLKITSIPKLTKEAYNIFALEAYYTGDIDNAVKYLKKYTELDITNTEVNLTLADLYFQKNYLDDALKIIDETKKNNPENVNCYLIEAKIYLKKGDTNKARLILQKAYKINPNNTNVLLALGNYYLKTEDYKKAKDYFSTLTEVNNELYEGYAGYIYSLIEAGDIKNAQTVIKKLKEINPESTETYYFLARICEYQGYFTTANDYISEVKDKSANPKYFLESAKINQTLKNNEQALSDLNTISNVLLNDNYDKNEVLNLKVQNYLEMNDVKSAVKLLSNNNELDKDSIIYKYNLYNIYKLQNDKEKLNLQIQDLKKVKLSKIKDYIDYSKFVSKEQGHNSALEFLDNAIKKFPNSAELYLEKIRECYFQNNAEILSKTVKELDNLYHSQE